MLDRRVACRATCGPPMSLSPYLLSPRGIAIVGASGDITRFGGQTVRALNTSGFAGGIYPVNP